MALASTTIGYELEGRAEALVDSGDVLHGADSLTDECERSEVMGNLVQNASPLLFPCAIEYSVICAAILYVMWKHVAAGRYDPDRAFHGTPVVRRSRHHYSVDCAKANKGLFAGIFVLVLTIISLILFFALINNPAYRAIAIMEVGGARFVLFAMAFLATIIGIVQVFRVMTRHFPLDKPRLSGAGAAIRLGATLRSGRRAAHLRPDWPHGVQCVYCYCRLLHDGRGRGRGPSALERAGCPLSSKKLSRLFCFASSCTT